MDQKERILHLYLTDRCNLQCKHCFMNGSPKCTKFLSWGQIKSLLDFYIKRGLNQVNFSGGETILSPHLPKAIAYAKEVGFSKISVASNGISPTLFTIVPDTNIDLGFSLDGATSVTHNSLRGPNTFNTTLENIKKSIALGYQTNVTYTVNRNNLTEIKSIISLMDQLRVDILSFNFLSIKGRAVKNDSLSITPHMWRKVYRQVTTVKNLTHTSLRISPIFLTPNEIALVQPQEARCLLLSPSRTEVSPQGHIFHCCLLVDNPKYSGGYATDSNVTFTPNKEQLLLDLARRYPLTCPARLIELGQNPSIKNQKLIPICSYYRTIISPHSK